MREAAFSENQLFEFSKRNSLVFDFFLSILNWEGRGT